jgi:hypothetical protein
MGKPKKLMSGLWGLEGSNQVQLTRAGFVNNEVCVLRVCNLDY